MASHRTLNQWLWYIENRIQNPIQLGLDRIKMVAARLGLLSFDAKVITVAGTNGKGSTVKALEAIYQQAGFRVASYTSPHLISFNERIRINSIPVSDKLICDAFQQIELRQLDTELTYFEMATLAAFYIFKQVALDVIILEVGLGGRLDATNIICPDVAIITGIDYDHQEFLGSTLEDIGYEKAGIFRPNIPCVYADDNPPGSVLNYARTIGCKFLRYNKDYSFTALDGTYTVKLPNNDVIKTIQPKLHIKSVAAAIVALFELQNDLPVTSKDIQQATNGLSLLGRKSVYESEVITVLDVAHNEQAVRQLASDIQNNTKGRVVYAVFGALKDKNVASLLHSMEHIVDRWFPCELPSNRACTSADLSRIFDNALGVRTKIYESPILAYNGALDNAKPGDMIVVYGSFVTVGAVLTDSNNLSHDRSSCE